MILLDFILKLRASIKTEVAAAFPDKNGSRRMREFQ